MEYLVKRPHEGDKWYNPGDIREANPQTVKHLVDRWVLVVKPADEDSVETVNKAKATPENKAAKVPSDKADGGNDQKPETSDAKE